MDPAHPLSHFPQRWEESGRWCRALIWHPCSRDACRPFEGSELKSGFRLLFRGSKEETILYVTRRESSLVLGYFLSWALLITLYFESGKPLSFRSYFSGCRSTVANMDTGSRPSAIQKWLTSCVVTCENTRIAKAFRSQACSVMAVSPLSHLGERCYNSYTKSMKLNKGPENKPHGRSLSGNASSWFAELQLSMDSAENSVIPGLWSSRWRPDHLLQPSAATASPDYHIINCYVYLIVCLFWKHSPRLLSDS